MKPAGAIALNPVPNLCQNSLREAAELLPAAHVFTLCVARAGLLEAKQLCKQLSCDTEDNIFSPYVNILVDASYLDDEWSLSTAGKVVWSAGC